MYWSCYLRKGMVYIPTTGRVEPRGAYQDIEPVAVVSISDTAKLRHAFRDAIERGNPPLPIVLRGDLPKPIMPNYAGVKSWSAFARGTKPWGIALREGIHSIEAWRPSPPRGWEPDKARSIAFPHGTEVDQVIDRLIAILREAAGPPGVGG